MLAPLFGVMFLVACGSPNATIDAPPPQQDAPPGPGQLGDDCAQHSDCSGGFCIEAVGGIGGVCTQECSGTCPAEWTCRDVDISGTSVKLCVPDAPQLCLTCADDTECGTGAACLTIDAQKSCATKCTTDCPMGYTCAVDPTGMHPGSWCQPANGSCSCTQEMNGASRACTKTNTIGTCFGTQMCNAALGWSACTAPAAALEACDGNDNDCDFLIDEGLNTNTACTNTVTGIGTCPGTRQCGGSIGYICQGQIPSAEKCNYADDNCNGSADETFSGLGTICQPGVGGCQRTGAIRCKPDGSATECSVVAGTPTTELCNKVDDDCNGVVDNGFPTLGQSCSAGVGQCQKFGTTVCSANGMTTTCSVTAGSAVTELCNGVDDDCNGVIDNGFSLGGSCNTGMGACQRYGTVVCTANGMATQCSATAGSATAEACNGIDDDCNGVVDNGFTLGGSCNVGIGACQRFGTTVCAAGGASTTCSATAGSAVAETCNSIDDDCNGVVDNGFSLGGGCSVGVGACQRFGTTVCAAGGATTTCSATAGASTAELCNSIDDDCNGVVDNGFALGGSCSAGLGVCQRFGTVVCATGGATTTCNAVAGTNSSAETCNYLDDDCNGVVDNGFVGGTGAYDQVANCGTCGNNCAAIYNGANASGACSTATGSPKCVQVCAANTSDLNNSSFDGCEFVLDNTSVYVSTTDAQAVDNAGCGKGPYGTGAGNYPCKTISYGIGQTSVLSGKTNVRVADGTYNEAVTLVSGKSLYGGYRPGTWDRHLTTTSTVIQGVSSVGNNDRTVVAVNITNTTFEGFVVRGSLNTKPSGNSYAIYISGGASSLVFNQNQIFAGRAGSGSEGAAGTSGVNGPNGVGKGTDPVNSAYDGYIESKSPCTASRQYANGAVFSCGANSTSGGNGGGNRCAPVIDFTQYSALNGFGGTGGLGGGGAGGGTSQGGYDGNIEVKAGKETCYLPTQTMTGADGANGTVGNPATGVTGCAMTIGSVSSGEWVNGTANTGLVGYNGGGGGGGAAGGGGGCTNGANVHCSSGNSKDRLGAHGGGGGAGGCGGNGGGGGGAGGGVFGFFIVGGTAPTLTNNTIQRGAGGAAGAGGIGGVGGLGGHGGAGGDGINCGAKAGVGGNGGNGGSGSGGGGGCGGSSFGIFTSGIGTPTYCTGNPVSGGSAGSGGAGGYSGGSSGTAGANGQLLGCTSI